MLLDVMTLDTLGVSALLYALAGYWTGRYGETTGRDRAHAPLLAVLVVTILVAYAGFGLHFLLGDDVSARRALLETLVPGVALNLLLAVPVFALVRAVLRRVSPNDRVTQVRFSG
jgi:rod shape-determining protein MreD